jgi:hypothetical protein
MQVSSVLRLRFETLTSIYLQDYNYSVHLDQATSCDQLRHWELVILHVFCDPYRSPSTVISVKSISCAKHIAWLGDIKNAVFWWRNLLDVAKWKTEEIKG